MDAYAASAYSEDLDGDGDYDILGVTLQNGRIIWWENTTGSGSNWSEHTVGGFPEAYSVYAEDMDNDGDIDVLGASHPGDTIAWWENTTGYGNNWTKYVMDSAFTDGNSVYAADVDGDGNMDILGAAFGADNITWWDDVTASGVDSASLSAKATDDGVLLSWSIVGDTPATVSVLRGLTQNGSVSQNDTVAVSGALSGSATSWFDVSVEAGMEYAYYLEVTELDGTVSRFGPSEVVVPGTVSELTLSDPYPNPASSALTISYELATDGAISLSVYDLSGRLVKTLVSGEQTAGRHSVSWDSSVAATGVYLIRLEAAGEAITKRAVISR